MTVPKTSSLYLLAILSGFSLTGCGDSNGRLDGMIRLDGKPIPAGTLTLTPLTGGPKFGGGITNGEYQVESLPPGSYRAHIVGFNPVPVVSSSAEMQAAAESGQAPDVSPEITAGALGNGVEIEVATGRQSRDFELVSPRDDTN